ncbi:uncharacterized protein LOC120166250 isoform X2 [Hibiscus syriacus]|uniref:uncharacterized protein LOC120166250 isoform X2 n=1 Tax=Hibiscus syriacus TaxID=106335 RepID=UPI001922188E|nr:uncharacterized protein LOC120166250 isoform X2 [Hibiscus syriacus]
MTLSRGCFGCFEPSKSVMIQDWRGRSFSEDLWSSSTCEIEHGALGSQRSISSISILSHSLDLSGSTSHPSEFVNHGLHLWNQTRQQWLGNKKCEKHVQCRESPLSCNWNVLYHSLHANTKPFSHPVPLSVSLRCQPNGFGLKTMIHPCIVTPILVWAHWQELVDFLDEVWEQEGLYD